MKKILAALLVVALGVAAVFFLIKTRVPAKPAVAQEKTWTVTTQNTQLQNLPPLLRLYAKIEAPRTANLSASINADVLEIPVREGDTVAKGAVLGRLEQTEINLTLQQRAADIAEIEAAIEGEKQRYANNLSARPSEQKLLKLARNAAERAQRLQKQQVASDSVVDEALQAVERQTLTLSARELQIANYPSTLEQLQARLKRAKAQRDLAQLDVQHSLITAPFNGIVAKVQIAVGERARVGTPLFSLYDTQALEARAQIPERYLGIVSGALQQPAGLQASATAKGQNIALRLDRFAGAVQANSGGTDALFQITEGAEVLRLGLFLAVRLQLPIETQVVAVPYEAIYGSDSLYLLVEGRMQKIRIERLGEYENAAGNLLALVRGSELQAGKQMVITHLPNAMPGLKVQAVTP